MTIHNWSKSIILVDLPLEPKMFDELDLVARTIREKRGCNIVLDFSGIDIITDPGIARILILYNLLIKYKRSLVLCNVSRKIKNTFTSNKLNRLKFVDGRSAALASLRENRPRLKTILKKTPR